MELALILGSFALVAAVGMLWWGVTARPSAARGNLFAGLPEPAPEPSGWSSACASSGSRRVACYPTRWSTASR